jgi:hypothetical protein
MRPFHFRPVHTRRRGNAYSFDGESGCAYCAIAVERPLKDKEGQAWPRLANSFYDSL